VLIAFDLDGVLLDSLNVVRVGYTRAGVRPPEDIFAYEGINWISEQVGTRRVDAVRERKNKYYLSHIHSAPKLPPYRVACKLASEGHYLVVLSAAPRGTIEALENSLKDWPFIAGRDGVRTPEKMLILKELNTGTANLIHTRGIKPVYIDDQDHALSVPLSWRFIKYRDQTETALWKEITR
jgi:phosphoglycolate phosphatase-like HAD superfamily hydrolase